MKAQQASTFVRSLSLFVLVALSLAWLAPSRAAAADTMPRRILAFYDGDAEKSEDCRIRRWAEAPLNHLGYVVDYRDARANLPAPDDLHGYAAVLTWFGGPLETPRPYLHWAAGVARAGMKFIVLGEPGGKFWGSDLHAINDLFEIIGIHHTGRFVDITFDTGFVKEAPNFEASSDPVRPPYPVITRAQPDLQVLEELSVPEREGGGDSVVAALSRRGGFVASGFELIVEPRLGRARWLIDPYAFFRSVLDAPETPRPDVTTASGRRVFLALVDIGKPEEVKRDAEASSAAILSELVRRHPAIPMTLSMDPQDFSSDSGAAAPRRGLLEDLLKQPQIEGAIRPEFCPTGNAIFVAKKACLSLTAPERNANVLRPPGLAENGARIGLLQLVSSEDGADAAIEAARRAGLQPIQEIFSRYTANYPSVAYLAPLARGTPASPIVLLPGEAWSPQAVQTMEDFIEMTGTSEKTEAPRRLAPLFWHFQLRSLADPDAEQLIEGSLKKFESAQLIKVSVRDYVALVEGFVNCEIARLGPNTWRVSKLGALHTFRIDDAAELSLDLAHSDGVLGVRRDGTSLLITIDAAKDEALIALQNAAVPSPSVPGLLGSGWRVSHLQRESCGWTFQAAGFGGGDFTWYDVPAGRYEVSATETQGQSWRASAEADSTHLLHFSNPLTFNAPVQFTVRCQSNASPVP